MTYVSNIAAMIRSRVDDNVIPSGNTDLLFLFYAVLLLTKGEAVTAEDVHNAWAAWMTNEDETHESIVEFSALATDVQREDEPFLSAIRQTYRLLRSL